MSGPTPHRYRKLRIGEVSVVDDGASPGARITLWKRRSGVEKSTMNLDEILSKLPEEQRTVILASIEAAQKAGMEAAKAEMQAAQPEPPKVEVEMQAPAVEPPKAPVEAEKSADAPMPEEIKKRLDAERAEVAKAKAERDALAKRLADIEDRDEQREYVAKAKEMPLPGLVDDELATVLRSVAKGRAIPSALATKIEAVIKSASVALAKSKLLDDVGAPGGGSDGDSPQAKLEAVAKSLKAADPKLSDAAAFTKAAELNPSLYAEARKQPTA